MRVRYRLGVDIGGTFTDATLIDEETGAATTAKILSTPHDPSRGFMDAVLRALRRVGAAGPDVRYVVHGTTVATNAIIEGTMARTAFITTSGFRDMLEIARQIRPSLYDPLFEKPAPLVPRHLCFEVPERLDAGGNVLAPLDENAVRRLALRLVQEGVESVAVCLLHGYVQPVHERRVGEILREHFPARAVSLSSEVVPEFREYLRASTTVINAGIRPVVDRYLERIRRALREEGVEGDLLVMQSNGGVFTASTAAEKPVFMVESGPAAGVNAVAHLGETLGLSQLISFDMGGTTAKVGLIRDGKPGVTKDYQVGGTAQAGVGSMAASGYPIRTPVIDLVEIGAGGGSIAWIDSGGMLRVGPRSAGADPGPVAYGLGGIEPTVTDANLVLGRLNPDFFLGGEMRLDLTAARDAIRRRCAEPLRLSVEAAANGIVEIANSAMVNAFHLVSVQRGYDPREFALVAYGGGGPVHANAVAAATGVPLTVVPRSPGVFSSLGLLVTDLTREYTVTLLRREDTVNPDSLTVAFDELERRGVDDLRREGLQLEEMTFVRVADMRYVGQSYELAVPVSGGVITATDVTSLIDAFHVAHAAANGFSAPGEPVELVNLRLTAVGKLIRPALRMMEGTTSAVGPVARRPVYFETGFVDCPIYDRSRLAAGTVITGPAILEEADSTTVVLPGYRAEVDRFGNLLLAPSQVDLPNSIRAKEEVHDLTA